MNTTTKRKDLFKGTLDVVLAILVILCLLSGALLAIRLNNFIKLDNTEVFLTTNMDTSMELFSVFYENESGEVTVFSADGQKLVAPGTAVDYAIHLRNTEKTAINYKLELEIAETAVYAVPIVVRMLDSTGGYVIGGPEEWVPIGLVDADPLYKTLRTEQSSEYIFQWKWEFESGDDAYDTQLGSDAVAENIGVSVKFDLHTEANTTMEENGGFMKSQRGGVFLAGGILLVLLLILAVFILIRRKNKQPK